MKKMIRSQRGFTLIEMVAVLVILGILAAVAVPKYIDMTQQAKISAAQGQVGELKSTLNMAYAKYFMVNGAPPADSADVITMAGFASGVETKIGTKPDIWNVKMTAAVSAVVIDVIDRDADTHYAAVGTWNLPQ
jgi:prepilin-type N-terminal cleavage/methylation domain-containing protein